jgi:hypothetical protein
MSQDLSFHGLIGTICFVCEKGKVVDIARESLEDLRSPPVHEAALTVGGINSSSKRQPEHETDAFQSIILRSPNRVVQYNKKITAY